MLAWLQAKISNGLRPTTARSYRQHIEQYAVPIMGSKRLRDVQPGDIERLLRTIASDPDRSRPLGPATVRRVHATLRSAFASAKRKRLIAYNPCVDIDLPTAPRPKVQPWEPAELGAFLDSLTGDRDSALFELIASTGLRRGEALGLRWVDVDLAGSYLTVRLQLVQTDAAGRSQCPFCGETHTESAFAKPKTASGEARRVDLDDRTVGALIAHRLQQDAQRVQWTGGAYRDHGLVFARRGGTPYPPERITKRFSQLVRAAGLRPVRLHDLRHGAASLRLASGTDIAVVSQLLGHSSISITADTYSHLLAGVGKEAAERASALVPRASDLLAVDRCDHSVTNSVPEGSSKPTPGSPKGPLACSSASAPPGTRTPNPRIKSPLLCQLS